MPDIIKTANVKTSVVTFHTKFGLHFLGGVENVIRLNPEENSSVNER
jgi:hypothetical protein